MKLETKSVGGYIDTDVSDVQVGFYGDGSLAVTVNGISEGYPDRMRVSVNLAIYGLDGMKLPKGQFYAKNHSEMIGLPDALEKAGIARKVEKIINGPYNSEYWRMELITDGS